jgi:hypothetical protein
MSLLTPPCGLVLWFFTRLSSFLCALFLPFYAPLFCNRLSYYITHFVAFWVSSYVKLANSLSLWQIHENCSSLHFLAIYIYTTFKVFYFWLDGAILKFEFGIFRIIQLFPARRDVAQSKTVTSAAGQSVVTDKSNAKLRGKNHLDVVNELYFCSQ